MYYRYMGVKINFMPYRRMLYLFGYQELCEKGVLVGYVV